jgi:hypothetical protein
LMHYLAQKAEMHWLWKDEQDPRLAAKLHVFLGHYIWAVLIGDKRSRFLGTYKSINYNWVKKEKDLHIKQTIKINLCSLGKLKNTAHSKGWIQLGVICEFGQYCFVYWTPKSMLFDFIDNKWWTLKSPLFIQQLILPVLPIVHIAIVDF